MRNMSSRKPIYIRVLVMKQGDQFLAQCLEHDLAAQASSEQQAIESFIRVLKARVQRDFRSGKRPFAGLRPAPDRFFQEWDRLVSPDETLPAKTVTFPHEHSVPDAYVISQIAHQNAGSDLSQ